MTEPNFGLGERLRVVEDAPLPAGTPPWTVGVKEDTPEPVPSRYSRLNWREILSDLAEIGGIGSISAGFWLISPAAGMISAGVGLLTVGVAAGTTDPIFKRREKQPGVVVVNNNGKSAKR